MAPAFVFNVAISGDIQERIQGLCESVVKVSQRLQASKTWVESEGINVLLVVCDLFNLVQELNTQIAGHIHDPSPVHTP